MDDEDLQNLEKHARGNVIPMKRRKVWAQATGDVLFEMDVANRLIERFGDGTRYAEGIGWVSGTGIRDKSRDTHSAEPVKIP